MSIHGLERGTDPELSPSQTDLRAGWVVSAQSMVWTLVASALAVVLGLSDGAGVLVAFGAIGLVDLVGSAALVLHFAHALRHAAISDRLERMTHRVVACGLAVVGMGTIAVDGGRLLVGRAGHGSVLGVGLAAVSVVALTVLSRRKRAISRRLPSPALEADSRVTAIGAALGAITVVGTFATEQLGWHQADAIAAVIVGAGALALGVASIRTAKS